MDTEKLGNSWLMNVLSWPGGATMESRLRERLMDPRKTLLAADIKPGQSILEVGCGTGFFTLPAAEMIGESGRLITMDPVTHFVEKVKDKIRRAGLNNVEVIRRDALQTGLEAGSVDLALLFGVLPFPTLPLGKLLPEMHRVLKPEGGMAVWMFPVPGWIPTAISRSGLFTDQGKKNGVYNYRRSDPED